MYTEEHECPAHEDAVVDSNSVHLEGVSVVTDFITPEEELFLVEEIRKSEWKESQSGRRKQDFGPRANFKKKKWKMGSFTGLPNWSKLLVDRMHSLPLLKVFYVFCLC